MHLAILKRLVLAAETPTSARDNQLPEPHVAEKVILIRLSKFQNALPTIPCLFLQADILEANFEAHPVPDEKRGSQ